MFTLEQGKKLIYLARLSISSFYEKKSREQIELDSYEKEFGENLGVFVTLTINNELRGCIGFPLPVSPLYEGVFDSARNAAFRDPRFPALSKEEFEKVCVEISVLTVPKKITVSDSSEYLSKIKIGRDGLVIHNGLHSGLLLPQVPIQWKWNVKEYLENLCQKAGLSPEAWKDQETVIEAFQAQVFSEEDGKVVEKQLA